MSRVAWSFDGYSFSVNPEKDSDFIYEHIASDQVPINATKSNIQFGGTKSGRRQISGYIWGIGGPEQFAKMRDWQRTRKQATLTDHLGNSSSAVLIKFEPELVEDIYEWNQGRQTYRYSAEFISLD